MVIAKWATQYLRPCSAALSHWVLSTPNSQRHASHSQRRPPAMLLCQSSRCFAGDDALPRFRLGISTTVFLVFMQGWMLPSDKGLKQLVLIGFKLSPLFSGCRANVNSGTVVPALAYI